MRNEISIFEFENLLKTYVILMNPGVRNVNISYRSKNINETIVVVNGKKDVMENGVKRSVYFSKEIKDLNKILGSMLGCDIKYAYINCDRRSVSYESDEIKLVL